MANISLTAPTDYSAELEDIQRRRKLAELMQMQSMQPLESPRPAGGWEIPLSPLSGVAKMVQAYGGSKGLESAKTRQQALAERLRGERAQDYVTLAGAMQPTPEKSLAPDPLEADLGGGQYESPQPMNMPARPAGITAATIQQLRTPEAQQAGMGMMAKQSEPYSLAPDATRMVGNTPVARGAPRTVAKPAEPEIMRLQTALAMLPEGDPNRTALENRIRNLAKPEPTYKEPEMLGGAYVQRENRPGGKVAQVVGRPPQVNVNTNMPPQERGFESELGKGQADELLKGRKAADDAVQIINTVNEGRKIMKAGMVTGFGANAIVGIGQALKQAGMDFGGDATANAQAFSANMAQNVGKIIKQFGSGTGLSDADREYAIRMAGGQIALDANAINKILEINERQARWVIKQHNSRAAGVQSNIPLTVQEPPSSDNWRDL